MLKGDEEMGPVNPGDAELFLNWLFTTLISAILFFGGLIYLNIRYDDPGEVLDKWIDRKFSEMWCFIRNIFVRNNN
ncbi:hypothetical protein D3C86_2112750 [compost metagenome]